MMIRIGKLTAAVLMLLGASLLPTPRVLAQTPSAPDQTNPDPDHPNDNNPPADDLPHPLVLTDMFIDISVPSHRIYINEMMRVQYDIYIAISRGQVNYDFHEPDFDSWYVLEGKPPKDSFITINNKKYRKEPFAVYYIFAFNAGSLPLPALEVTAEFENPPAWISSEPHTIEVLLPQKPYPPGFDLHNIGDFTLEVLKPDQTSFSTGQLIEFEFVISGNAPTFNVIDTATYPRELQNTYGDTLKVYPLTPTSYNEEIRDDQYFSEMHYKAKVIALKPGSYTFPPLSLMTFSPTSQHYELKSTDDFSITVEDNGYVYTPPVLSSQLEFETLDPKQINLIKHNHVPRLPWFVFCLPLVIFAAFFGGNAIRRMNAKRRKAQELELHKESLFQDLAKTQSSSTQLSSLRELLSLLIHTNTEPNIHLNIQTLCDAGLSTTDALSLSNLYDTLSRANYSNQAPLSSEQTQEAIRILRNLQTKENAS